jgi:hypothetical protein
MAPVPAFVGRACRFRRSGAAQTKKALRESPERNRPISDSAVSASTERRITPPLKGTEAMDRQMKARLVAMANANESVMDGTMTPVRRLVDGADIVFAVWQDHEEPDGVGTLLVKGQAALRRCVAPGVPFPAVQTAIKCINVAQAYALAEVCGEARHPN